MTLVTPKAGAEHELLFNELASEANKNVKKQGTLAEREG
jgi:hypothetical protein